VTRPAWLRLAVSVLWIAVKLTLVAALLNRNASNFIYAGF
jgi:hypothetical protein